jgi:hypothetical protein
MQKFTLTSVLSLRGRKQICDGVIERHAVTAVILNDSFSLEGEG